jgi:hypothetical protein
MRATPKMYFSGIGLTTRPSITCEPFGKGATG